MVELFPGHSVYLYKDQVATALNCQATTGKMVRGKMTKPSGKWEVMGRYMMGVFFTSPELVGSTMSTKGKPGQKVLPQSIIESIAGEFELNMQCRCCFMCSVRPNVFAITQEQG
jgi:hypothetical protein